MEIHGLIDNSEKMMKEQRGNGTVLLVGTLAAAFVGILTIPAMLEGAGYLVDKIRVRPPPASCVHDGAGGKLFGIGYRGEQVQDGPCNQRAAADALADLGLIDAAQVQTCAFPSNVTVFATVDNCLQVGGTRSYAQINADVLRKQVACGGPKPKWGKRKRYARCMGR